MDIIAAIVVQDEDIIVSSVGWYVQMARLVGVGFAGDELIGSVYMVSVCIVVTEWCDVLCNDVGCGGLVSLLLCCCL